MDSFGSRNSLGVDYVIIDGDNYSWLKYLYVPWKIMVPLKHYMLKLDPKFFEV